MENVASNQTNKRLHPNIYKDSRKAQFLLRKVVKTCFTLTYSIKFNSDNVSTEKKPILGLFATTYINIVAVVFAFFVALVF